MKKVPFLMLFLIGLLGTVSVNAQVTIGANQVPDPSAVLDLISQGSSNPLGMLVPRMSEADRDNIVSPANGLLIFNTDEKCFNYYDYTDAEWNSLCGGVTKSTATSSCSDVAVYGAYMAGTPLNSSNYLTMIVNVTKAGAYNITATTANGYGFSASGTFLNPGIQQVTLAGQGIPTNESPAPGDEVTIEINGSETNYTCTDPATPVMIQIASANPTYTMDCSSVKVNGMYSQGIALNTSNNITIQVNVADLGNGQWSALTNTVDGISFSGNGVLVATGLNTITLNGYGTPTSTIAKNLTITINSAGITKTCSATVIPIIPPMTVLELGNTDNWGLWGSSYMSYRMLYDQKNFGILANSTVKFGNSTQTWVRHASSGAATTSATVVTALNSATPPDIVTITYNYSNLDATSAAALATYLQNGGVVVTFCENVADNQFLLRSVFNNTAITCTVTGSTGRRYPFITQSDPSDPIMRGPFGDLTGLYWGEDLASTNYITGLTADNLANMTVYSTGTTGASTGNPIVFRHNTLSLLWVGDGGFNAGGGSATVASGSNPFYIDSNNLPQPRMYGSAAPTGLVYNSRYTANAMAWALQQAMINRINKQ